ncbi:alpha/beta fold hydrolase [Salinigranum sp. GCM10025319]|uniref:alpha/beta fold hydrolase n=1 Tax=Salinigranum sp. GCM10025319 TaxID=3252687 RepID=UPI00360E0260
MPSTIDHAVTPADLTTDDCSLPDGRTLAYATAGDPHGTSVLVHHGTPGSRLFAALLSEAARDVGVRLVVPDRPGYGRSSPPPDGWTWTDWRADCDALLAAESIDRAGSLGFSGGGPFALATAASDRTARVGLVSALVPPLEGDLATLARIPYAIRVVFRLTDVVARVTGPGVVLDQYTERDVDDNVAAAVAADFHEALRQGAQAPARENRLFTTTDVDMSPPSIPIRAWHGTHDENTPLNPLRTFVRKADGRVLTHDADHLGTLLDARRDALAWLADAG